MTDPVSHRRMDLRGQHMKIFLSTFALFFITGCTTIHFRSNNTIPISFTGNPQHQKEVVVQGKRNFYWWGTDPDFAVVFVDDEIKRAGYSALSKAIIYEQKNPYDILISFLTFGVYLPRAWAITGFTEGASTSTPEIKQIQ